MWLWYMKRFFTSCFRATSSYKQALGSYQNMSHTASTLSTTTVLIILKWNMYPSNTNWMKKQNIGHHVLHNGEMERDIPNCSNLLATKRNMILGLTTKKELFRKGFLVNKNERVTFYPVVVLIKNLNTLTSTSGGAKKLTEWVQKIWTTIHKNEIYNGFSYLYIET